MKNWQHGEINLFSERKNPKEENNESLKYLYAKSLDDIRHK